MKFVFDLLKDGWNGSFVLAPDSFGCTGMAHWASGPFLPTVFRRSATYACILHLAGALMR